ncbi:MAG: hypothetical protein KY434_01950, partial [Actinobacteria bacterium]|nr:hypothetical protein [Actinomycetota bacterium]
MGARPRRAPPRGRLTAGERAREAPTTRPPLWAIYAITVTGITVNTLVAQSIPDILDALRAPQGLAGVVVGAATLPGIVL